MIQADCILDLKAQLGEGIFWHAGEQALYFVDIPASRLYKLDLQGKLQSWHFPPAISAAAPCERGGLVATLRDGLYHLDLEQSEATRAVELEAELPRNRFNDGCSDGRGQFWFGSMDNDQRQTSGSFYRMDARGQVHPLPHLGSFCISNGPAFSADGQQVFFTDTVQKKIYRADIDEHGAPGQAQLHIDFDSQPGYPDGMCVDTEGGLWVCQFGGGRVSRFLPSGALDQEVSVPAPNVTRCAFGGPDLATLYITTASVEMDKPQLRQYPQSGGIFAAALPYQGLPAEPVAYPNSV